MLNSLPSKLNSFNFLKEEKGKQFVLSGFEWFEASLVKSSSKHTTI